MILVQQQWLSLISASLLVLLWAFMQYKNKLPTIQSMQEFSALANSRGGNILILAIASLYFFKHSMALFDDLLRSSENGKIGQDNAFALMGLQFATSSAFGGAFGALLKTMTGESSKARATDTSTTTDGTDGSKTLTVKAVPVVESKDDRNVIKEPTTAPPTPDPGT